MKLFAISDLHVGHPAIREALESVAAHHDDWLILAGDVGETEQQLDETLRVLSARFRQLIWVPGNHELWRTSENDPPSPTKYQNLVARCRARGVLTPEDEYVVWQGEGGPHLIVPLFLLYDYSFRPSHLRTATDAIEWAAQAGLRCADEDLIDPAPYHSIAHWCAELCQRAEARLDRALEQTGLPTILINHFPLKQCLARLPAIPRFQIWCGTTRTERWHVDYHASAVVSGHLHIRTSQVLDGTRFEEVSVGYPHRQWLPAQGLERHLRQVLPARSAERAVGEPAAHL